MKIELLRRARESGRELLVVRFGFNVPPGWPTPPPGWVPPAGWRPPPSWPPPPVGWRFWIEVAESSTNSSRAHDQPATTIAQATAPPTTEKTVFRRWIPGASYYDGQQNILVRAECIVTSQRLIILDIRGVTNQTYLHEITSVGPLQGLFAGNRVEVKIGTYAALEISCDNRQQVAELIHWINVAVGNDVF